MKNLNKSNQINGNGKKIIDVINRYRAGITLLTDGFLMESLTVPECELCHSRAMTVNHLLLIAST